MTQVFKNSRVTNVVCWLISFTVIGFNVYLFFNYLDELNWPLYAVVFSVIYFVFVLYLIYIPLEIPTETKEVDSEQEQEEVVEDENN
jgi:phosphotransferase system  glucose/maltose/N-acetylglucosamine-specific IIC component